MAKSEGGRGGSAAGTDVNTQIQQVLREAYLEATEVLRDFADKIGDINGRKKAVREYLAALRECKASVLSTARERGVDLCRGDKNDLAAIAEVLEEHARAYDVGEVEYELCIPDRVPPPAVKSVTLLQNEIAYWNEQLAAMGDDADLANIDLQNALQKQQQALQMMSDISKMSHDSAMAIIRKMSG